MKFGANIPSTQIAGVPFTFETTIDAVDIYDNICTGANSAPAYNATPVGKTITYTLSGVRNGPETGTDVFVNPVEFVNGSSTTVLSTTLYRDQTTTITPSVIGLNGTNVASNVITVGFSTLDHLRFSQQPQQPSGTAITNVVLAPQPSVAVVDSWGNPIKSASGQVTLRAMLAGGTPGTYVPTTNGSLTGIVSKALATGTGTAAFTNITYNYPEDIYIEATVSNYVLTPVYSLMVSLATAQDATIAKVAQAGTTISSLATTSADKAPVLGFTIADAGTDGYATKIRQIVIKNTNTGTTANWTAFIEGAFLSDGSTEIQAYSIIDNKITFGSGSSVLYTINNSASKTYTLKLMLK